MSTSGENLDEFAINEKIEQGEQFVFTRPVYTQGWFIGFLWLAVIIGVILFLNVQLFYVPIVLSALAIIAGLSLVKVISGIRKVEIAGDMVRVYGMGATPKKEFRFSNMTTTISTEEIFLIKKKSYSGGVTLRRVYWGKQWPDIKTVFRSKAAYIAGGISSRSGVDNTIAMGSRAGGGALSAIPLLYDMAITPYLSVCRALFGR